MQELIPEFIASVSLKLRHYMCDAVVWSRLDEQVYVVGHDLHLFDNPSVFRSLLHKKLFATFVDSVDKDFPPVLGTPNDVVSKVIYASFVCLPPIVHVPYFL